MSGKALLLPLFACLAVDSFFFCLSLRSLLCFPSRTLQQRAELARLKRTMGWKRGNACRNALELESRRNGGKKKAERRSKTISGSFDFLSLSFLSFFSLLRSH